MMMSLQDNDYDDSVERSLQIMQYVVTLVSLPLNVIFNGLVVALVCVFSRLQDEQNILIACLACCDIMFGLVVTPLDAALFSGDQTISGHKYGCIATFSVILMVTNCRCCFLLLLTMDRYFAVTFPFWYLEHVRCGNVHRYVIFTIFAYLLLVGSLPFMGVNEYEAGHCEFLSIWPLWFMNVFYNTVEGLTILVPTVLNILIFQTVRKQQRVVRKMTEDFCRVLVTANHGKVKACEKNLKTLEIRKRTSMIAMLVYMEFFVFNVPKFISTVIRVHYIELIGRHSEPKSILYFDYIATTWQWGFMPAIYPVLLISIKEQYRKAINLLAMTPFWRWTSLKYERLGHEFSTTMNSPGMSLSLRKSGTTTSVRSPAGSSLAVNSLSTRPSSPRPEPRYLLDSVKAAPEPKSESSRTASSSIRTKHDSSVDDRGSERGKTQDFIGLKTVSFISFTDLSRITGLETSNDPDPDEIV